MELRLLDEAFPKQPVTIELGYSISGNQHDEDDFQSYDLLSHNGSLFFEDSSELGFLPYNFRIHGGYTATELDGEPYSEVVEGGVRIDLQLGNWAMLSPSFTWNLKDFENDTDSPEYWSRDGNSYSGGTKAYLYLFHNRLIVGASYFYRDSDTDGSQFVIRSHDVGGSVTLSLPYRFRCRASVDYKEKDYEEFLPEPRRFDDACTYYVSVSRPILNDAIRAEVHYTYTTSNSNQEFSDYERNVVGASLSISL